MADEEITSRIRRLFEDGFNQGNYAMVQELIDPAYVDHSTMAAPKPGVEGFKQRIASLRTTFPEARFTVEDIFVSCDKVALRWSMSGTDKGGFRGRQPTGKAVVVVGLNIERLDGGKIVEHWSSPDNLGMLQQLGMVPISG